MIFQLSCIIKDKEYVEYFKKAAEVHPCIKKVVEKKKVTTGVSVFCQMFQKFTKVVCMIRSIIFYILYINEDFLRVTIPKLHFFPMVEEMLLARDKNEVCGAILTDLPKSFNCTVMICS